MEISVYTRFIESSIPSVVKNKGEKNKCSNQKYICFC
jgi:hypothetical protein